MTTKIEPLLSERMRSLSNRMGNAEAYAIMQGFASDAEAIEAARAKDAELIHGLLDALRPLHGTLSQTVFYDSFPAYVLLIDAALELAAAAGFTPSEQ